MQKKKKLVKINLGVLFTFEIHFVDGSFISALLMFTQ